MEKVSPFALLMEPRPLRIAYFMEFLLAVIAFFEGWSQIGGQGSMDNMPWWMKLVFSMGFAYAIVRLTAAAVANQKFPNVPMLRWLLVLLVILGLLAASTYYFQPPDQSSDETDDPVTTSLILHPAFIQS